MHGNKTNLKRFKKLLNETVLQVFFVFAPTFPVKVFCPFENNKTFWSNIWLRFDLRK